MDIDPAPKMYSQRVRFCIIFTIFLPLTYTFIIGTFLLRPCSFHLLQPATEAHSQCPSNPPLQVYMYDLPGKFNVEMLSKWSSKDSGILFTRSNLPLWPNWGMIAHYSMEYWLMASLLHNGAKSNQEIEVVRVADPEAADVFFVPFFSSLSFHTPMLDGQQLQVELVETLQASKYWQRSKGRDHVIPLPWPDAFGFLRQQLNASIFIVVDFGPIHQNLSSLHKDVVAPYTHVVETFVDDNPPDPYELRPTLLHFRGDISRSNGGEIRHKLGKILGGFDSVIFESSSFRKAENIKVSTQEMRSSKFCLHPAGNMPSSSRLFDIIVSHCVPVIVSDNIKLPFEDELDYSEFSLFFSIEEAVRPSYMINQLRNFPKARWMEMWKRIKNISHHFEFQYPPKKEDAINMLWRQVKHKLPAVKLAIHRSHRLQIPDWWEQ